MADLCSAMDDFWTPYRLTLATPAVEGDYEVRAIATDAVGNEAASPTITAPARAAP